MSSRVLGALLVLATSGGGFGASALFSGCSDDAAPAPVDAGAESAPPDANRPPRPEDSAAPKSCRDECAEAHPTGLPKDEAINSCWRTFCSDPCIEELPADGGGVDGAARDGGTCVSPVVTVSLACDDCTSTSCCASWDDCFQDPECIALNACYQQCAD